ncbi:MAG: dTMP kinase [Firmicutes bacterium HGW-Firmicutes-11]|nr:MAG: dTMP kinase [Firmicutes bacterium HGW-Firmicutes-11]
MSRGAFITFEGPDGSGKSTQIRQLESYLTEKGVDVFLTREPGGTEIGEKIRHLILDPANHEMDHLTEALLYAASRAQHVAQAIRPALEQGRTVICDRFMDSSIVYQGFGRRLGTQVRIVNEIAVAGLVPDLTFLLLVDPIEGKRRISDGFLDRLEREGMEYYQAVYDGYLQLAKECPSRIVVIDGASTIEEIQNKIRQCTDRFLLDRERRP